jgi:hypothetical protein
MNPRNCNSGFALTLAISFGILVNCASGRRNVTRNLAHQTSSPAHVKLQTTSFLEKGVTTRRMIAALKHVGGNPRYTEYKGVGHNAWERAFAEPDLLPWMFAQRAAKQP